jgi:hypothetical protein
MGVLVMGKVIVMAEWAMERLLREAKELGDDEYACARDLMREPAEEPPVTQP